MKISEANRRRVYVEHYGCWLNRALTEYIKQLAAKSCEVVESPESADLIVVNTCAVRAETERKILARLQELSFTGKQIAVTGCLVNVRPHSILKSAPEASLVDPSCLDELKKSLQGERVLCVRAYRRALFAYKYTGGVRYVVPIQSGCLGSCGFCVEPIVRKGVVSLDPQVVVQLVKEAVRGGAREVYLTGQDVAAYGVDLGVRLTDLLRMLLEEVEGEYRVRLGMMESWMVARFVEELAQLMRDERVYKYLHLPLQSGDDEVLKLMRRKYTVGEYKSLAQGFREWLRDASLVTDVIVGYPGESWSAFMNTVDVIKELKFDKVHVARYTFRPFTPAYLAESAVPEPEKKRRSRIATMVAVEEAARRNSKYVGRTLQALVTERKVSTTLVARTDAYKPVVIPGVAKLGEFIKVRIEGFTPTYLVGEVVD